MMRHILHPDSGDGSRKYQWRQEFLSDGVDDEQAFPVGHVYVV